MHSDVQDYCREVTLLLAQAGDNNFAKIYEETAFIWESAQDKLGTHSRAYVVDHVKV